MALLHFAADLGLTSFIHFLLNNGADIDIGDKSHLHTPLMYTIFGNQPDSLRLLIEKGANINKADKNGNTPLNHAYQFNNKIFIDLLRQYGGKTGEELKAAGN